MHKNFYLFLLVLLFNTQALAKYKIVTSITPLASLAAMLLDDKDVDIISIVMSNDCPHHFHATPAHLKAVQRADVSVYIDESFDGFAAKLMHINSENVVKISDIKLLNISRNDKGTNWHIWLDLNNVNIILKHLSKVFSQQFPELKTSIEANLEKSLSEITELLKAKEQKLLTLSNVILLSDSLEYFFTANTNIKKLYEPEYKSLKFFKEIDDLLSNNKSIKCLILSADQNVKLYEKYDTLLIQMESENWVLEGNLKNLYLNKYSGMLNQLKKCISNDTSRN